MSAVRLLLAIVCLWMTGTGSSVMALPAPNVAPCHMDSPSPDAPVPLPDLMVCCAHVISPLALTTLQSSGAHTRLIHPVAQARPLPDLKPVLDPDPPRSA